MVNSTFNKFGKKLPPVKTGQRFGEEVKKDKKVGLFSERRFLIFTKKGPIEIAFKPIHYTGVLITTIVGLTSIIYWSAKGIYSAIDVAKKNDIITEASANINTSIENDSDTNVNINIEDQSNITLPILKKTTVEDINVNVYQPIKNELKNQENFTEIRNPDKELNFKDKIILNSKRLVASHKIENYNLFNKTRRNQEKSKRAVYRGS